MLTFFGSDFEWLDPAARALWVRDHEDGVDGVEEIQVVIALALAGCGALAAQALMKFPRRVWTDVPEDIAEVQHFRPVQEDQFVMKGAWKLVEIFCTSGPDDCFPCSTRTATASSVQPR